MTPLRSRQVVGLILMREVATRTRSKAYLLTSVLLVLAVAGLPVVLSLVGPGLSSTVGVTPSAAPVTTPLVTAASAGRPAGDDRAGAGRDDRGTAIRAGQLDALVVGPAEAVRVVVKKNLDNRLRQAFDVLAQQQVLTAAIASAGGDPQEVRQAMAAARVEVRSLQPVPRYRGERIALGVLAGILVYGSLMIYGPGVAQGVVEEKTSRVVELLLATVRPWQLMLGKVLGIGLVGLLQFAVVAAAGLAAGLGTGQLRMPSSVAVGTVGWTLLWYLLGFLLYALLFAAAGALVSCQEDIGGVTGPILMLIIVPYVVGISVLPSDPDSGLARTLSLIPVFSPMLMPIRIALGVAPGWEMGLTVALTGLLTVALVGLAARVYRNSVMRTGARVPFREALRAS